MSKVTRRGFLGLFAAGIGAVVTRNVSAKIEKIGNKEGRYPLLYTTHEGGKWEQWPSETPVTAAQLKQRADIYIIIGDRQVHSLRFWERKGELIGWRRWDCVNGWNRIPEPAAFMPTIDSSKQNQAILQHLTDDGYRRKRKRKAD